MRTTEVWNLEYYGCGADLELKVNGQHCCCPKCGAELDIQFRIIEPEATRSESPSSERTTSPEPVGSRPGR